MAEIPKEAVEARSEPLAALPGQSVGLRPRDGGGAAAGLACPLPAAERSAAEPPPRGSRHLCGRSKAGAEAGTELPLQLREVVPEVPARLPHVVEKWMCPQTHLEP